MEYDITIYFILIINSNKYYLHKRDFSNISTNIDCWYFNLPKLIIYLRASKITKKICFVKTHDC